MALQTYKLLLLVWLFPCNCGLEYSQKLLWYLSVSFYPLPCLWKALPWRCCANNWTEHVLREMRTRGRVAKRWLITPLANAGILLIPVRTLTTGISSFWFMHITTTHLLHFKDWLWLKARYSLTAMPHTVRVSAKVRVLQQMGIAFALLPYPRESTACPNHG